MKVTSYVITTDQGSAPNYQGHATTLTICKPRIRRRAKVDELIIAFNGRTLSRNPHSVRWAGIVSEVIPLDRYWDDPRFRNKRPDRSATPDNIYRLEGSDWVQVPNQSHADEHIPTDISGKNAMVFSIAWHFGNDGPELPERFGLRVNGNRRLEPSFEISLPEWLELKAWLDAHNSRVPAKRGGAASRPRASKRVSVSC